MLISEKHQFIFIHIYKTAGTSITYALMPYCVSNLKFNLHRLLRKFQINHFQPQPYSKHITAKELKSQLGEAEFNRHFRFSFVRNPWDWQVSLYNFMINHPEHPKHSFIRDLGSFENYIHWRNEKGIFSQKKYLSDADENLLVDYIGKFETLAKDFDVICRKIGIQASLPHLHKSKKIPYQNFYTSETRDIVYNLCKEDIELFGYSFS